MEKLSQFQQERFNKESCKCAECHCQKNLINDPVLKAKILDAEAHKDLLDPDLQCSHDHCWECTNTLC